jgi:ubiquinone/menaquinone biosynthesis C-methylase UbiE
MEFVVCDICGVKEYSLIFEAKDYLTGAVQKVVRCKKCGLAYVNPRPSPKELSDFYPQQYYGENPFFYEKLDAFLRFRELSNTIKKGDIILDVGCGRGLLLSKLQRIGCEVWGTELSEVSARYAKENLNLSVISKNLNDCIFDKDYFDVVTMFHSLEHMMSPMKIVEEIYRILKPDGTLIIELPRFNSLYTRIFRDKWFHLDVPRHLYHFSDSTLQKLLASAGFDIIKEKHFALMYDSFGCLQSMLNCLCAKQNILNDLNTKRIKLSEIMKSKEKRFILDSVISLGLQSILFIPFTASSFILSPFNIGGTLTVHAKKR